jgi:hypothetical protein
VLSFLKTKINTDTFDSAMREAQDSALKKNNSECLVRNIILVQTKVQALMLKS